MKNPIDPETLRIPAFMRKKSLDARARRIKNISPSSASAPRTERNHSRSFDMVDAAIDLVNKRKASPKRSYRSSAPVRRAKVKKTLTTSPRREVAKKYVAPKKVRVLKQVLQIATKPKLKPIPKKIATPKLVTPPASGPQACGIMTHYFEKIKVGVIAVSGSLSVGDTISYMTEERKRVKETVKSMEMNRTPVFSAETGDEVGIKLKKKPELNSVVTI